ncbi:recombinase family protein [Streptomyces boninensis]|uniref:recombinase family protein n=1 Tax=Streptomyces boninensis TaxID=2039455 RepID=UPI003B21FF83
MGGPDAIRVWLQEQHPTGRGRIGSSTERRPSELTRIAWIGRTSTSDLQDPTISLPRQLATCRKALPANVSITLHFYDVESGRKEQAERGQGAAHEELSIPIHRDGGFSELLSEARRPDRRFDAVICDSIDRISRYTRIGTEVEHQLEEAGIPLLAADEPLFLHSNRRASMTPTQVLTRRMKQGVAEWYVLELLEKSWAGWEAHTEQGYNVGKPCYGYRAQRVLHPVPARRAKGAKKTRLEPDPVQGPVVSVMFRWRATERLGYQAVADRLNGDLTSYPPPEPIRTDTAVGRWTSSNVRDVLTNPKYTGHMVWNRRARKGKGRNRPNPVEQWVWSTDPVHEPLIDLETFVQAQRVTEHRARSRGAAGQNRHPQAKRTYRLRSFLFCAQCGRRLYGKTSKGEAYYVCSPNRSYRPQGHPPSIWVGEDGLVAGLNQFLAKQVFGGYREELLSSSRGELDAAEQQERVERRRALRRAVADTEARRRRLVRHLELVDDLEGGLLREVHLRHAELRAEQEELTRRLGLLDGEARRALNPGLLQRLPVGAVDLTGMTDQMSRALFEALRLEIRYDRVTDRATCTVTLTADTIEDVAVAAANTVVVPFRQRPSTRDDEEKEGDRSAMRDKRPSHPSVWRPRQDSNLRPSA